MMYPVGFRRFCKILPKSDSLCLSVPLSAWNN